MTTEATQNAPAQGAAPDAAAVQAAALAAAGAATPAATEPLSIGEGEPAQTPPQKDAPAEGAVSYDKTGDVGLDMALDFVGKLGFGPEDPAMAAAIKGDFGLLKAKLGALGAKAQGWEGFVALAEKAHTDTAAKTADKVAKDTASIHNAVGGKDQWAAISKWAGANAEPHEKTEVNAALAQGGMVAKAMAVHLSNLYAKAVGTTVKPASAVNADAASRAVVPQLLSASEYAKEVQSLRGKMGYKMEGSSEYKNLQARRMAGKAAGR